MNVRHLSIIALSALVASACSGKKSAAPDSAATNTAAAAANEAFKPLALGDTLPRLAQRTLAGDTLSIGGTGTPLTLVNVWATWCTSCREEMQDLEAIHRDFSPKGLRVVAVSVDEGDGVRVQRFVDHEKLTFNVTRDEGNRVQDAFRVMGVPESYLLGTDGKLLWHRTGGIHGGTGEARTAIAKAVGGA